MMFIIALLLACGVAHAQSYDRIRVKPFDRTFRVDSYPEDEDRPYRVVFYDDGVKSRYRFNDEGLVRAIYVEDEQFSVLYTSRNELKRVEERERRNTLAIDGEDNEERLHTCAECTATWTLMCGVGVDSVCDLVGHGDPLTEDDVVESINIMCTEFAAVCDALTAAQACSEECETAGMCDGEIVGVQDKDICCSLGCGQCGGPGCSSAGGLTADECCTTTIEDSGVVCGGDVGAPCILSGNTEPPATTGMCDGEIVGVQDKDICCSLGCGQCGGPGCSSAGGLTADECCTTTIEDSGVVCGGDVGAPCILSV